MMQRLRSCSEPMLVMWLCAIAAKRLDVTSASGWWGLLTSQTEFPNPTKPFDTCTSATSAHPAILHNTSNAGNTGNTGTTRSTRSTRSTIYTRHPRHPRHATHDTRQTAFHTSFTIYGTPLTAHRIHHIHHTPAASRPVRNTRISCWKSVAPTDHYAHYPLRTAGQAAAAGRRHQERQSRVS